MELELTSGEKVKLEINFDEYNLNVKILYTGVLMEFPEKRPTEQELLNDDNAFIKLSGFLMRKYSNKMTSTIAGETCTLQFSFEH